MNNFESRIIFGKLHVTDLTKNNTSFIKPKHYTSRKPCLQKMILSIRKPLEYISCKINALFLPYACSIFDSSRRLWSVVGTIFVKVDVTKTCQRGDRLHGLWAIWVCEQRYIFFSFGNIIFR